MAETPVVTNLEIVNASMDAFALRQANWIDARVLAANTAETFQAPALARFVLFSGNLDFYAKIAPASTAAAIPAADITDGTSPELNPAMRYIGEQEFISLIAAAATIARCSSSGNNVATKLFLRSTLDNAIGATYFDMLAAAGALADTGVVNTTPSGASIQWTKTAGGALMQWVSGRAPAGGFTLTTTDISIWARESNLLANCGGRYSVFHRLAIRPPGPPSSERLDQF